MVQQGPAASWGWELQGLPRGGKAGPHQPGLSHHPSWGAGQAEGQLGTASALDIRYFPGDGDWPRLSWHVGLQVGVRIRPGGGNWGQAQPKMARQGGGDRDGPRPGRDINPRVKAWAWIRDHGSAQARLQHGGAVVPAGAKHHCLSQNQTSWAGHCLAGAELQGMLHRSAILISFL